MVIIIQTTIIAFVSLVGMTMITNAIKEVMVEKEKTEQRKIELFKQMEEMGNWE